MKRAALVAALTSLIFIAQAPAARAHGIGGRIDLPVPISIFLWGAAAVVIASFLALIVLWKEPRLESSPPGRALPSWFQRIAKSRPLELAVRGFGLVVFLLVVIAAFAGDTSVSENIAPVLVYVWVWVGLAFAHVLFGNLWRTLSPFDTLARVLEIGRTPLRPYPLAWGRWPAAVLLFGFVWLELAHPSGASPQVVGQAMAVYAAITFIGMTVFGRETWNRNGEAFAVYFDLLSRIAPIARKKDGAVIVRPPLAGLPDVEPRPGLVAFLMVAIGSTTFDGFSSSNLWLQATGSLTRGGRALADTGGLIAMILAMAVVYSLAMGAAAAILRRPRNWHPLAVRFIHSLIPIAFAYAAAHYFSLLVLEGQQGIALLSDPFGAGWDLFGTADFRTNLALLSANAIWYVQVGAIVTGHIAGVVLAHDRSVAMFPSGVATKTQYALLAVMVLFTIGGLVVLSGA